MGKGMSGDLVKDSNQVVKLGMGVLIGLAVIGVMETLSPGTINSASFNSTITAFETALAVYGSFVIVYIIWSIAKPIMAGFGKN